MHERALSPAVRIIAGVLSAGILIISLFVVIYMVFMRVTEE